MNGDVSKLSMELPIHEKEPHFFFPMFFKPNLLDDLKKAPYKIEMRTKYLGLVRKGQKGYMIFGISPKGYVHFWLGDLLINLKSTDDWRIFLRHRAYPDRLGKHFIKNQLEAEFVNDKDEN